MNSTSFVYPLFLLDNGTIKQIEQTPLITVTFAKDLKVAIAFLQKYNSSKETIRSYVKEIERLLIWCIYLGKINIFSLQKKHVLQFHKFLQKPRSKKIWCGPAVAKQTNNKEVNPKWRLFVKDLSNSSINKSFKILKIFFNYLVTNNYLINNPIVYKNILTKPKKIENYLEVN